MLALRESKESAKMETFLRRYTELPYLIDFLVTGELALLNPATWDDRNDSYYIEEYARQAKVKSVYALCMADCPETYHHWRVFSHGSGGACVQFNRDKFISATRNIDGLRSENVSYRTINDLRTKKPNLNELPFLKRYAFLHEGEFRLFYSSKNEGSPIFRIPIPLSCIDRVILSPWLAKSVADNVKKTIKLLPKCSKLKVYRSTLVENENWKKFATTC